MFPFCLLDPNPNQPPIKQEAEVNSKQSEGKHYYRSTSIRHSAQTGQHSHSKPIRYCRDSATDCVLMWTENKTSLAISTSFLFSSSEAKNITLNKKYLPVLFSHLERDCGDILSLIGFQAAWPKPLLLSSLFPSIEWEARDSHWIEITNPPEWEIFLWFIISVTGLCKFLYFVAHTWGMNCEGKNLNVLFYFKRSLKEKICHSYVSCGVFHCICTWTHW